MDFGLSVAIWTVGGIWNNESSFSKIVKEDEERCAPVQLEVQRDVPSRSDKKVIISALLKQLKQTYSQVRYFN